MTSKILTLALTLVSLSQIAVAVPTGLKLSAWHQINKDSALDNAAEVCGYAEGTLEGNERVLLTVDYNTNAPGEYVAHFSPSGNFCHVVNTLVGRVRAEILDGNGKVIVKAETSKPAKR